MKIDTVIGNPPYQRMDGGGLGVSAIPLYQDFVTSAMELNADNIVMIIPSRWFSGGKGLNEFRALMIEQNHIKEMHEFFNCQDIFANTEIAGGVCYFLWNKKYIGKCKMINHSKGFEPIEAFRNLSYRGILIRDNKALSIIEKTDHLMSQSLDNIVYPRNAFEIPSDFEGKQTKDELNTIKVYCKNNTEFWVSKNEIDDKFGLIDKYSVIVTKASGDHYNHCSRDNQFNVIPETLRVLNPGETCSETFLCIGSFDNYEEAYHLKQYICSKLFRFLLLQNLSSINISRDKFSLIPILDFSKPWNEETLNKLFNLSDEEIEYIDKKITFYDCK